MRKSNKGTFEIDRKHLFSTIVRLSPHLHQRAAEIQGRFRSVGPGHYFYPLSDVHLTIKALTPFCTEPGGVEAVADICQKTFAEFEPFPIDIRGVRMSSSTVFLRAFSEDGTLAKLRRRTAEVLTEGTGLEVGSGKVPIGFAHLNIIRFNKRGRLAFLPPCLGMWRSPVGRMVVDRIELVRTDKVLSQPGTEVIAVYRLDEQSASLRSAR